MNKINEEKRRNNSGLTEKQVATIKEQVCELFLEDKSDMTVGMACKITGIGRRTFYDWLKDDKDFAQKVRFSRAYLETIGEDTVLKKMKYENSVADSGEPMHNTWKWLEKRIPEYNDKHHITLQRFKPEDVYDDTNLSD